jgi:hypothetical protein
MTGALLFFEISYLLDQSIETGYTKKASSE